MFIGPEGEREKTSLSSWKGHLYAFFSFISKDRYNSHNFGKYVKYVRTYIKGKKLQSLMFTPAPKWQTR